jgi:chemotaxis signal transduction protein
MVERVLPALEITRWPGAPRALLGNVVLQGRTVGVLDIRHCLGRRNASSARRFAGARTWRQTAHWHFLRRQRACVVRTVRCRSADALVIDDLSALAEQCRTRVARWPRCRGA